MLFSRAQFSRAFSTRRVNGSAVTISHGFLSRRLERWSGR